VPFGEAGEGSGRTLNFDTGSGVFLANGVVSVSVLSDEQIQLGGSDALLGAEAFENRPDDSEAIVLAVGLEHRFHDGLAPRSPGENVAVGAPLDRIRIHQDAVEIEDDAPRHI
jgi:hypothetical protein